MFYNCAEQQPALAFLKLFAYQSQPRVWAACLVMQEIQYVCGHAMLHNSRERSVQSVCSCKAICSFTFTVAQAAARGVTHAAHTGVNEIKATPVQCAEVGKKNIY